MSTTTKGWNILNIGCGTKTSPHCINIDRSFHLRFMQLPFSSALAPYVFRGDRLTEHLKLGSDTVVVHDLRRGIPAADHSADAVYHSHVLENTDRPNVPGFMAEVKRVLKAGGIHRIVVPDLKKATRECLEDLKVWP